MLPRWLARTVVYCLAVLVLGVTVWLAVRVLALVAWIAFSVAAALLLAALLYPLVRGFTAIRLPRWLAALLSVLLLILALLASVFLVVNRAISQVHDLRQAVTDAIQNLKQLLVSSPLPISRARIEHMQDQLVGYVQTALPSATTGATVIIELLSGVVLALFVLFFFLKDGPGMWDWAVGWTPKEHHRVTDGAGHRAWETLTSYVHGTVVVALIDAIGIGVAMFILGVPLAISLTLIVFIGAFVPIVGATVSGALAVGITLVTLGPLQAVILLGVVLLVQQIEGNLLQPLIMGHNLRLHPVVIVVTVSVGTVLGGILGAIVAVPVVAVCYRVAVYLATEDTSPG
jgi:predicted PurR-regulated permease PerM